MPPEPITPPIDPTAPDRRPILFLVSAIVIALDRLSKLWVSAHVPHGGHITLIPHVFALSHVFNTGAAFSLFAESLAPETVRYSLITFSVLAVLVVAVMLIRLGREWSTTAFALALILGGALGNLYDRIHLRYVIDFLEVRIYHYHYPDFNLADSAIVIGAILLLLEIFRAQPDDQTASA